MNQADELKSSVLDKVSKHSKVKPFLTGRTRPVLFETEITNRFQKKDSKQAVIGLYNYDTNKSMVALIDLKNDSVIDANETLIQFQLNSEEEKEAEDLVSKDHRIKDFLKGRKMNPLVRLYFPNDAIKHNPPHRYALVFVRPSNTERKFAAVDLSEKK
jgi:Cu2+-containing amine oxidase